MNPVSQVVCHPLLQLFPTFTSCREEREATNPRRDKRTKSRILRSTIQADRSFSNLQNRAEEPLRRSASESQRSRNYQVRQCEAPQRQLEVHQPRLPLQELSTAFLSGNPRRPRQGQGHMRITPCIGSRNDLAVETAVNGQKIFQNGSSPNGFKGRKEGRTALSQWVFDKRCPSFSFQAIHLFLCL